MMSSLGRTMSFTPANVYGMDDKYTLTLTDEQLAQSLLGRMGIVLTHVDAISAQGTMPVAGNTQPYGLLHGGASAVLAETLGSFAAGVHAGAGKVAVGVDLNITHHRSVTSGCVTGEARALHRGRSTATYSVAISQSGHLVASARLTCMIIDQPRVRGNES